MSMRIYPNQVHITSPYKFKINQNRRRIMEVVLKSGVGQYRKLLCNDMRHYFKMSKQGGEPHVKMHPMHNIHVFNNITVFNIIYIFYIIIFVFICHHIYSHAHL